MNNKYLYIYDFRNNDIGKFLIIKETPKQIQIDYKTGKSIIDKKNIWISKEYYHKDEIDNQHKYIYTLNYEVSYTLEGLYNLIKEYLNKKKSEYEKIINFMEDF